MAMEQQEGNGSTVLMVIAIGLLAFGLGWGLSTLDISSDSPDAATGEVVGESDRLPIGDSPVKGAADAPITVVEFTSMQCPFCARAAGTLDELVERYDGDVRLVFKHFPLGMQEQAEPASRALVAVQRQDREAFWDMKDALFERIDDYDAQPMEDLGAELAGDLGLDVDQFREDFNDPEVAEYVQNDQQLGQDLGVRGTPHFFINGEVVNGAQPIEEFEQVVDRQLELIQELRDDGVAEDDLYAAALEHNLDSDDDDEQAQRDRPEPQEEETEVHHVDIRDTDPVKGASEEDALVTIMEFSSFQCPHCARSADTLQELVENYPDEVRIVFKHFPLGMQEHSEPASRASVAAHNQGQFWEYYDALYENQRRFSDDLWVELAEDLGLDIDQFTEDFEAQETADIVEQAQADGRSAGIRGTPGFLINGIQEGGAQPLQAFENYVDEQIEIAESIRDEEGLSGDELHAAVVDYNKENAGGGADAPQPEAEESDFDPDDLSVGDSFTKGADDPELTIYEFSSFQCPFCARAADTMEDVMEEYGDRVQLVYKNFPLPFQGESEPAARAAVAAGQQGQFWEMYEALYDNQDDFGDDLWERLAEDIGLDMAQFRQDFESDAVAEQVEAEQAEGRSVGVQGTPAFFIGEEEMSGAQPYAEFERVIERQL